MIVPLLLALAGCQLFGLDKKGADRPSKTICPAPPDPALLGTAPDIRNEVLEAARAGLVVVHYRTDGCVAELEVESNCRLDGSYAYEADGMRRSALIQDEVDLFEHMPLHPDALSRALEQYGAMRVDEEIVGRLAAPRSIRIDRSALAGECADATHVATAIELGGASVVAGPMPTIRTDRNWFLKPARSKTNPVPLQYLGRVSTCRKAQTAGKRTPGCDHPLRVRLLPIIDPEQPKEAPPSRKAQPHVAKRGPEMIAIPAGDFIMGTSKGAKADGPAHTVHLSAFEIDRTEVTVRAYASCVAAGACTPAATGRFCNAGVENREDHPINCVTWKQASAYCAFVKKRLPTEAEWERAARGTDGRRFVWGNAWPPPKGAGNFADRTMKEGEPEWRAIEGYDDGHRHTAPVSTGEGLVDLAGNVAEWVNDWFDPRGYPRKKVSDPKGPESGAARVVRGGSFGYATPEDLEVTHRMFYFEDYESAHIGFRCAR